MTEQPLTQAQDHDRRIGRLEGIAEQLDHRLDSMERTMAAGFAEVRSEMRKQFRWLVGIQLTTLIAIGSLLFGLLGKLP